MSPGFIPRPSLSGSSAQSVQRPSIDPRVAGVHPPAFVERENAAAAAPVADWASVAGVHPPAFVERRRSLLEVDGAPLSRVSPGFIPRPSLSEPHLGPVGFVRAPPSVAGVHPPAFVERRRLQFSRA